MNCFPYLVILILSIIIHFNKSNFISDFDDEPIWNKKSNFLSEGSLRTRSRHVVRRIIGGLHVTRHSKYAYMAYLLRITVKKVNETRWLRQKAACGATILSETYALSAANCFRKCSCVHYTDDSDEECKGKCIFYGADNFTLYTGDDVANKSVMISKIKNVFIHPEHKFVDRTHQCLHRYDIAVMELATKLTFGEKVKAVSLPQAVTPGGDVTTFTSKLFNKDKVDCFILGWGVTGKNDKTKYLLEHLKIAKVHLIDLDKCKSDLEIGKPKVKKELTNYLCTDTDICSKSTNDTNAICSGDGGGPIICNNVQVGVSSWSRVKCVGEHVPSMYTRVEFCITWIHDIMSGGNNRKFLKP